jgi:formylglycine-generating enzyme required for sulfatase activity
MTLLWAGLGVAATVFVGLVLWFELAPDVVQPISAPAPTPTETPEVDSPSLQQPVEAAPPGPEPGSTLRDCEHCPQLVVLPAGSTRIGAEGKGLEHVFETPVHTVTFEQPFAIGVSEVTRAEFAAFVEDSGSALGGCRTVESQWQVDTERSWERPGFEQTGEHPVTCVSWLDAQAYLAWLRRRTGENYRLASEAEWEFAARGDGSDTTIWSSRPESVCQRTNVADMTVAQAYPGLTVFPCEDGFPHTAPVASGEANGYGLRGMRGNVFEWTQDCWNPSYHNAPGDGSAREIGDCNKRVLRGGSWFTAPSEQRLTFRNRFDASYRSNTFGFRVVREVPG